MCSPLQAASAPTALFRIDIFTEKTYLENIFREATSQCPSIGGGVGDVQ
jgi:hypothetical protein